MNFMSTLKTGEILMELKYCERCGGLWLRPQGADVVYCRGCQEHMAAWPLPSERLAPELRGPKDNDLHSQGLIDVLPAGAEIEVRP